MLPFQQSRNVERRMWQVGTPSDFAAPQVATFTFSMLSVSTRSGFARRISRRIATKARGLKFSSACQASFFQAGLGRR